MKKSLLLSTLIAASFAFASTAWAEEYTLTDGDSLDGLNGGTTASTYDGDTISVNSGTISSSTEWGTTDHMGAWIHWTNDESGDGSNYRNRGGTLGSTTITGSGFLGLAVRYGASDCTADWTAVDVSGFSGQISLINTYGKATTVQLSGDQWKNVEYVFGTTTAEWAGIGGSDSASVPYYRGVTSDTKDTLALQGNTTFAGITGSSKGCTVSGYSLNSDEFITVVSGTTLTIDGAGTYEYYGTLATSGTRASLAMTGSGSQTFGGTNYLQDVTVTAGTLALGGTTSIAGSVSVAANSTLALSGEVTLAETIQNSGTVTIDSSTVFVLDNLSYDGELDTGATFTLITNVDSGSVEISGTLDINNVSSATSTIESATFEYTEGVLKVTVTELSNGLHGSGGIESPYYTTGSGTVIITDSGDGNIFTGTGTTVYLATETQSFGNSSENVYLNGTLTAECNIVIGKAGVYLTNATSSQYYNFLGAISGEGSWTHGKEGSSGSPALHYAFAGDLSQWSGDFTITYSNANDIVIFGGTINGVSNDAITGVTGVVAVTDTNVSGTGAISVGTGTVRFNYVKPEEGTTGYDTVTIGNSSITAAKFEFTGSVNYIVSASTTITSASSSGSFVVSTEGGTVTILGTLTTGNANNSFSSLSVAEGSTLRIGATNTFYMDTTSTSGDVFVVSGTLEVAENVSFTVRKRTAATNYSIANLKLENGSTFTLHTEGNAPTAANQGLSIGTLSLTGTSANLTISNHANYVSIGEIIGTSVNLTITANTSSSRADLVEFGSSTHDEGYESTSQFTGTITMVETSDTGDGRAFSMAISEENILAGAVIVMGSENSNESLSLGINAERVEIAGLSSEQSHNGADILYSGIIGVDAQVGNNGANITSGSSTNTLAINVADTSTYTFYGKVLNNLNLEKLGGGSQTITFESGSSFDGSIAVKAGTLALSGADISSTGLTVEKGATLTIGNTVTLATTTDVDTVSSTIAGTLSVTETGSLALSGSVELSSAIQNSGSITIADGTSITVGVEVQTGDYNGTNYDYYTLIDGSNGSGSVTLGDSVTFVIDGTEITLSNIATLADGDTDWKGYISGGSLFIYAETSTTAQTADNLTWAGTSDSNTWNTSTDNTIWKNNDAGGDSVAFTTGSNVTFDGTAENKSVVLGEDIEAGSITVTGTGYEFSGEHKLTATELILADTDTGGEHTFTIAENTTVEVEKFTEDVGQMNLVVNGELSATSMHIDSSENEVISGSGSLKVNSFTYDAAQGSSLTISVADASFSTLYEQPYSGSDDSNGDYRKLIIGSADGDIPNGAEHSTEVAVGTEFVLAGKSEIQVNKNSELSIGSLTDSSDYDTKISGDGSLLANYVTFGGKGEVTISIAMFDVGDITFSNSGKLTISSSTYFLAYTATFSNSGEITIAEGANVIIGEATSTENHTITVEENATFTVGSLDQTQNQLTLVVNGTMNVEKGLKVDEYYTGSTSGLLSFGDSTSDSKTDYNQTLSGTGTVNVYGIEDNLGESGKLTISVANLNIGEGGITEYGNSGIHIAGTTIGLYNTTDLTLSVPLVIDSAGATFNTNEAEKLTLSGAITGNGMVTKDGEGDLILAGTGSTLTSGLTVLDGTLSVATDASLTIGGTVDLSSAIQNSGSITIADSTSFVMDNLSAIYDAENKRLYYEVVTRSGDGASVTLNDNVSFTLGNGSLDGWTAYTDGNGNLYVYSEEITSLIWAGTTGTSINWTTDTLIMDWTPDGGTTNTYFFDGANVIFDTIGTSGISSEVKIAESVTAGTITVNDEYSFATEVTDGVVVKTSGLVFGDGGKLTIGDDVTVQIVGDEPLSGFSVDGTIVGTGTLQLELSDNDYSATVNLGTENKFAGTVYITAGNFTLNGSDIGNGTFRLGDGVNMQVNSSGTEVGNNFILEGTSQVHINANDSLLINGNVTGVETDGVMGGTFDRQGAGDLTIAGNVDIGTFIIDTSGSDAVSSTTFSGSSVTIGTLDVKYADSVVFSGGDESSLNIGKLTFEAAGVIEFKNGGTVGTISYDKQSSSGIIRVSGGTLEVGTITNTYTDVQAGNETLTEIEVGTGAVLHAETITIAPGNAGSVYSTISGTEEGSGGTVIADKFNVGSAGGASVEVSDVTLIVGGLSFGTGENSNFNLYLKNATLGFTKDVTISATTASGSNSRLVLGGFASSNSTATGEGTTTTINTSKYDVETGAFTSTGVTVTISQIISGQGALVVDGVGKLILSGANDYSGGTTIKEGATVVVQNESALGSGNVSVASGATLELDTAVTVTGTESTVTFAEGASIVLGGDLLNSIIASADTQEAVAVITANDISFGEAMASSYTNDSDTLTTIVSQYVTSTQYGITWSWSDGTLWAVASIPEPSTFGVLFGLGALGLVATRRRRRRRAA